MSKLTLSLLLACAVAAAGCTQMGPTPSSTAAAKRDAEFNAAVRHCDSLASPERSTCIEDAKAKYGRG